MKFILSLSLLICYSITFSQSAIRIFYNLESKTNTEKDTIVSDVYVLDFYPKTKKSHFYNYVYNTTDSIMTDLKKISDKNGGVSFDFNKLKKMNVDIGVINEFDRSYTIQTFDGDYFKYEDKSDINWKILNDKKTCGDYTCQKATANFKGRQWEIWFTNDVPIYYGPYKFNGLPGMIYEATDKTGSYKFTFIGLKKIDEEKIYIPTSFSRSISTTKSKYLKAYKNYTIDPAKKLREGILVTGSGETIKINGGFSKSFIDKKTAQYKKAIKENNNPIEL